YIVFNHVILSIFCCAAFYLNYSLHSSWPPLPECPLHGAILAPNGLLVGRYWYKWGC
ncbi:hypothetical protein C0J52_17219, partial [Blattella germanica]